MDIPHGARKMHTGVLLLSVNRRIIANLVNAVQIDIRITVQYVEQLRLVGQNTLH